MKKKISVVELPPTLQAKVDAGIVVAAAEYSVDLSGHTTFTFKKEAGHFHGNKKMAQTSVDTYKCHYKMLWIFLATIGDYSSMLLLVSPKLANVPSMRVESLGAFVRYKKMAKGTVLRATDYGKPVTSIITKEPLMCTGEWKCNQKMDQFSAAISRLHVSRERTGEYSDVCVNCLEELKANEQSHGCGFHRGSQQRVVRRGNPTCSTYFKEIVGAVVNVDYKERGCNSIRPKDLRLLRTYLPAGNSIFLLGSYVAMLVAVCLFLRSDEILHLKVEHFIPDCFVRVNNKLRALCLKFKGKTDNGWKYFWLWVDDECPDFCPVRHLLIYVHLAKIKHGYIFPTEKELFKSPPSDRDFKTFVSYSTFPKFFKRTCEKVLTNGGVSLKIGLHVFRKTGYKFAIWGHGDWEVIKNDARHIRDKDARKYAGDAESSMVLADMFQDPMNRVKEYVSTFCLNPDISAIDNEQSTAIGVELTRLASQFIISLGVASCVQSDMKSLLDASMTLENEKPASELFEALAGMLNSAEKELLNQARKQAASEQTDSARRRAEDLAVGDPKEDESLMASPAAKKHRHACVGGSQDHDDPMDLDDRKAVATLQTIEEKVLLLMRMQGSLPASTGQLTPAAKTFVVRTLNPVLNCLKEHFDNDVSRFSEHWRATFKMKFSTFCCKGVGLSCTLSTK